MKRLLLFTLFLGMVSSAHSQEKALLTARVSADSVLLGNFFELTITLEDAPLRHLEMPIMEGFEIVGGPKMSSNMSIINGKVSQTTSHSYFYKPLEIGLYAIPPIFVETDSETLETDPIEIFVVPNNSNTSGKLQEGNPFELKKEGQEKPAAPQPNKKRKVTRI